MSLSVSHIGKKWAYYNDVDPFCCEWVRNLIKAGHVAPGVVDERPIEAVQPEDLREFCQVHMFCGIAV
jgi:DNA (cytosine-5)-methyltransferase 1